MSQKQHTYYVYIVSSLSRVLYIGVTNDLNRRMYEHKFKTPAELQREREGRPSFTHKYRVNRLVYFEETSEVQAALEREKELKNWLRAKKVALVAETNPQWLDLSASWFD